MKVPSLIGGGGRGLLAIGTQPIAAARVKGNQVLTEDISPALAAGATAAAAATTT